MRKRCFSTTLLWKSNQNKLFSMMAPCTASNSAFTVVKSLLETEQQGKYPVMWSFACVCCHQADFASVDLVSLWVTTRMKMAWSLRGIYSQYVFAIAYLQEDERDIFKITNFKGKNWLFAKGIRLWVLPVLTLKIAQQQSGSRYSMSLALKLKGALFLQGFAF